MAGGKKKGGALIIVLALLLIVILGGVYVYFQYFGGSLKPASPGEITPAQVETETEDIIITAQSIPRGVTITEEMLATIAYPKEELIEGTFFIDKEDVIGKTARYDLDARIPLTTSLIADMGGNEWSPSFDIPAGKTALSIPVNGLTSVSYGLLPGDHVMVVGCMWLVDVDPEWQTELPNLTGQVMISGFEGELILGTATNIGNITQADGTVIEGPSYTGRTELNELMDEVMYIVPSEPQRPRLVCQNIIQDAIVLKLGEFPLETTEIVAEEAPVEEAEGEEAAPVETPKPEVVTLIVSPQESVLLNYMMLSGIRINLSMRNPVDGSQFVTDAVTQQYLMDQKAIPLPAKLPFGVEPMYEEPPYPLPQIP